MERGKGSRLGQRDHPKQYAVEDPDEVVVPGQEPSC